MRVGLRRESPRSAVLCLSGVERAKKKRSPGCVSYSLGAVEPTIAACCAGALAYSRRPASIVRPSTLSPAYKPIGQVVPRVMTRRAPDLWMEVNLSLAQGYSPQVATPHGCAGAPIVPDSEIGTSGWRPCLPPSSLLRGIRAWRTVGGRLARAPRTQCAEQTPRSVWDNRVQHNYAHRTSYRRTTADLEQCLLQPSV